MRPTCPRSTTAHTPTNLNLQAKPPSKCELLRSPKTALARFKSQPPPAAATTLASSFQCTPLAQSGDVHPNTTHPQQRAMDLPPHRVDRAAARGCRWRRSSAAAVVIADDSNNGSTNCRRRLEDEEEVTEDGEEAAADGPRARRNVIVDRR